MRTTTDDDGDRDKVDDAEEAPDMTHLVTTLVEEEVDDGGDGTEEREEKTGLHDTAAENAAGEAAGKDAWLVDTKDDPEPPKKDFWLSDTVDAEEDLESARERDRALREALSNTFSSETDKGKEDAKDSRAEEEADEETTVRSFRPQKDYDRLSELDFTRTTATHDHDKAKAVREAIAEEWASDKPMQEKIENAIELALYFYRIVMKGDTAKTLGLLSIEGFQKGIRRQVRDWLQPDDDLAGVGQALRIISTLGRDKGWRWADDVTLALFNCENEGFTNKANEIRETLPMLINKKKLAVMKKLFS